MIAFFSMFLTRKKVSRLYVVSLKKKSAWICADVICDKIWCALQRFRNCAKVSMTPKFYEILRKALRLQWCRLLIRAISLYASLISSYLQFCFYLFWVLYIRKRSESNLQYVYLYVFLTVIIWTCNAYTGILLSASLTYTKHIKHTYTIVITMIIKKKIKKVMLQFTLMEIAEKSATKVD